MENKNKTKMETIKETKAIILDDNALSIMKYAEEFPENWKRICESLDKKQTQKETGGDLDE